MPQACGDVSARQGDELMRKAPKEFLARSVVPTVQARQKVSERI
jgi:hypothetical protein